ncbi:MAG: Ig-like domain-containing protein [Paracoccaceae bacterium]
MAGLLNVAIVLGGAGADVLTGSADSAVIHGDLGNDTIAGGSGDETIIGGSGADLLRGGAGDDVLYGGLGNDTLIYTLGAENGEGIERIFGDEGIDTLLLEFTAANYTPAIQEELSAYALVLAAGQDPGAGREYVFSTLDLRAMSIEALQILVDGVPVDPQTPPRGAALDDAFAVTDNGSVSGDVSLNDVTEQGDVFTLVTGPTDGDLSFNGDGTFSLDLSDGGLRGLSLGETTTLSFVYELQSPGRTDLATVTVTVTGVNETPQGGFIFASVSENDVLTGNIFTDGGASDADANDTLRTTPVTDLELSSGALLTVAANGDYTYDPRAAFNFLSDGGSAGDSFTVSFDDGNGGTANVGASLTITGVNDAPTVGGILLEVDESDQSFSLDLFDGVSDPEGDDLTITSFRQVSGVNLIATTNLAAARFEGAGAYDFAGGGISLGDVNGDGFDDFFVTLSTYGQSPGGGVLIFGEAPGADTLDNADENEDGVIDIGFVGTGTGLNVVGGYSESGGRLVAGELGDLNGDGVDDFLVADTGAGANAGGNVYVVFGGAAGISTLGGSADLDSLPGGTGITLGLGAAGALEGDDFGGTLLLNPLGDVDGDGVADFLIGSSGSPNDAVAHFVSGAAALAAADANGGFVNVTDLLDAADNSAIAFNVGPLFGPGYFAQTNLATGDIDGDNINDLLIGVTTDAYDTPAETYIIFGFENGDELAAFEGVDGSADAAIDLEAVGSADGVNGFVIVGAANGLSVVGDVNGDGIDDIFVATARGYDEEVPSGFLIFGGSENLAALDGADGVSDGRLDVSFVAESQTGFAFSGVDGAEGGIRVSATGLGDIDGDGLGDFAIANAITYIDQQEGGSGRVYILFGGDLQQQDALGEQDGIIDVTSSLQIRRIDSGGRYFGGSVDSGDINGDGFVDLLIDDQRFSRGGDTYSGAVQVLFGGGGARLAALAGGAAGFGSEIDIIAAVGTQTVVGNGLVGALDINGGVSFNPEAFDELVDGEEEVLVFEYIVSDGVNQTVNTLTIKVSGEGAATSGAQALGLQPLEEETTSSGSTTTSNGAEVFFAAAAEDGEDEEGEVLIGDSDSELIEGTNGPDLIRGGAGDDLLIGMNGADTMFGGADDDELRGGRGFDEMRGGRGDDLLIGLAGYDELRGGKGEDSLNGGNGNDSIFGGNQADFLIGGRGRDMLVGGDGSDRLTGGSHQDTLEGGAGQDVLIGSLGIDTFVFKDGFGNDRVMEFNAAAEILDFTGHTGVSSMADLDIQEAPNGTFIFDGAGDRIFLVAIAPSEIDADNFLF